MSHHNQFSPNHEHHIHYHYHYHYDKPSSTSKSQLTQVDSHKTVRLHSPRTYASSIETNGWKQHVNPEVSKLYKTIRPRQSRFS
jgi:hypothetical protein